MTGSDYGTNHRLHPSHSTMLLPKRKSRLHRPSSLLGLREFELALRAFKSLKCWPQVERVVQVPLEESARPELAGVQSLK